MSTKINEEQKNKVVAVYEVKGNLVDAAAAVSMSARTLIREKKRNKAFREAMEEAKEVYCENIKRKMHNMTEDREAKQPQFLAIMAQARANMPEYRDKAELHVNGNIKIISSVPRPEKKEKKVKKK